MAHVDTCPVRDPDACFGCKLAYMRDHGSLNIAFQGGRAFFHDKTIKTEQKRIVERAKAKGNDVIPYHSVYGH